MSSTRPNAYSRRLRDAHDAGLVEKSAPDGPRRLISASWRRSLAAGIDPDSSRAPLAYDTRDLPDVREAHPLRPLLPLLARTLVHVADESAHIMVVTDADGRVLWRDGNHDVMRVADRIGLAEGHHWAESHVGTNGIGTALAIRRPMHVYSEEHLMRVLHVWSCSAAPIVDPETDEVLGCVDLSGTARSLHPASVALVAATARLAESRLELRVHERDDRLRRRFEALRGRPGILLSPTGRVIAGDPGRLLGERVPLPAPGERMILRDGRVVLLEAFADGYLLRPASGRALSGSPGSPDPSGPGGDLVAFLGLTGFLGGGPPVVTIGERRVPLSLRHAEILALLALHPNGLTADQLSLHLYGDDGNPATIRAEIHRLRTQLGDAIGAKPYQLTLPVEADFLELRRLLAGPDRASLAHAYAGPLLPRSESPEIRRERDELEAQVRTSLLLRGSPDDLWTYAQTPGGRDDFEVLQRLTAVLAPSDHRAAAARARLRLGTFNHD
ncbi:GAF domain-containing protein [Nonomuraea rhizosphaerae]|uniref:GAF domain-containing protein n=1 Tax=Nonomuraea rhizosphaerae TaxID=2665663 RepID=UPI001C5F25C1|nr:helix-turn-helix domain-containing protein [Nonomuraea rhizosphaerae]